MGTVAPDGAGAPVYTELAAVDVKWLRTTALSLRAKIRRSVQDIMESGRLLVAARRRLGRERWPSWLALEAQVPERSARRLCAVGRTFAHVPDATLRKFTPTALYSLAEPGVPQSIREYALEAAGDGEDVTDVKVREWVALQRDTTIPERRSERAELMRLAPDDGELPDEYVDPADVFAKENWVLLRELVGTGGAVHLSGVPDTENEDESFAGTFISLTGERRQAAGGTLEMVVLSLAGGVRKKECRVCGLNKALDEFCRRADMPDGREYRCKVCERERVKAHTARKAERKAAG